MPIGVPRIIYCWGEELPAQWTDIYNFIFRRRMVFLMQYLDDELCNQICGLLINIHMEDRSKEMEKSDIEKSGLFKSTQSSPDKGGSPKNLNDKTTSKISNIKPALVRATNQQFTKEDLLKSEGDLGINDNYLLEQKTLQKITMDWLNWNTQFIDYKDGNIKNSSYKDQPYFFYLAEILSKDFNNKDAQFFYNFMLDNIQKTNNNDINSNQKNSLENVYSPFRFLASNKNFNEQTNFIKNVAALDIGEPSPTRNNRNRRAGTPSNIKTNLFSFDLEFLQSFKQFYKTKDARPETLKMDKAFRSSSLSDARKDPIAFPPESYSPTRRSKLFSNPKPALKVRAAVQGLYRNTIPLACNFLNLENEKFTDLKTKQVFGQRHLKREYTNNIYGSSNYNNQGIRDLAGVSKFEAGYRNEGKVHKKLLNYLNTDPIKSYDIFNSNNDFSKKDKVLNSYAVNSQGSHNKIYQDEEAKKVFMIINSFGGSVGNGITVHDALQFIKAGSMTLALGVAASAASLALAGGTIGERYVTEGCHVMIHQPEGGLTGQASDIWVDSLEILKIKIDVAEIYSLSTYRPRHKILRDLDRDFYLTATDAIQYGLCDEIATNEIMHEILDVTSKVWDYHDTKQQRLLESREGSITKDLNTQTQN